MTGETVKQIKALLFLLGILGLAVLVSALSGCAKAHKIPVEIITATQNFSIGQYDETHFGIRADTMTTALKAAEDVLDCKKRPCVISPGGIVLLIERPAPNAVIPEHQEQSPRAGR